MTAARKLDTAAQPFSDEDGIVLPPEDEEALERAIAEAEEDVRAGRFCTFDDIRAKLRRTI